VQTKFYTIPSCPHCEVARAYLVTRGVDFVEFDLSRDGRAFQSMLQSTGRSEVPTLIAGYQAVIGFRQDWWDEVLDHAADVARHDELRLPDWMGPDPLHPAD
jgi:glutaredoxin 3